MSKKVKNAVKYFIKIWVPFIVWIIVIYSFSSNPTAKTSEIHWQDFVLKKSAHIVEYFVFSLLLYRGLINSNVRADKAIIYVIFATFFYGLTDEWHQSFTPGREPRLRDVAIDTSGAVLFVYSLKKIIFKNEKLVYLAKMVQLIRD